MRGAAMIERLRQIAGVDHLAADRTGIGMRFGGFRARFWFGRPCFWFGRFRSGGSGLALGFWFGFGVLLFRHSLETKSRRFGSELRRLAYRAKQEAVYVFRSMLVGGSGADGGGLGNAAARLTFADVTPEDGMVLGQGA
jgi:hypothetical protein